MYNIEELPIGLIIAALVAGIGLVIAMFSRPQLVLLPIAGMFFVSSIAVMRTDWGVARPQWLFPIQTNRTTFFLYFGLLLIPAAFRFRLGGERRPMAVQAVFLVLISLFVGLTRIFHEGFFSGMTSMVFTCVTMLPLALVLPALLEEFEDFVGLLRALMFSNVAWIAGVVVQLGVNPTMLTAYSGAGRRFVGLTSNPQSAGIYVGVMIMIALWLLLNDQRGRWRLLWAALAAVNGIMLLWTGSRTGMGMAVIGVSAAIYGRIGRTVLLLPAIALSLVVAYQIALAMGVDLAIAERLTSTTDTRTGAWLTMIDRGMKNPLIGVGVVAAVNSENSYLYGFASSGVGAVLLILGLMIASAVVMLRAFRMRSHLGPLPRSLVDLFLGYNMLYFSGAVLEGYMIGRVTAHVVLILVVASMTSRLIAKFDEEGEWAEEFDEEEEWEFDDDGAEPAMARNTWYDDSGYDPGFDPRHEPTV